MNVTSRKAETGRVAGRAWVAVLAGLLCMTSPVTAQRIYWTDVQADVIRRAALNGHQIQDIVTSGLEFPSGLAIHKGQNKVYWSDALLRVVKRANLDGTEPETILFLGSHPWDVALDADAGKLYVAHDLDWISGIVRINLDGSGFEEIVTLDSEQVDTLVLDAANGKFYFSLPFRSAIYRANLDGSDLEEVAPVPSELAWGLAVDSGSGKLYWSTYITDTIQRANLDGSDIEILPIDGVSGPGRLLIDRSSGKLYWVDHGTQSIRRCNLDGSGAQSVYVSPTTGVTAIALDSRPGIGGIPAASTWGLLALAIMLAIVGTIMLRGRFRGTSTGIIPALFILLPPPPRWAICSPASN